MTDDIQIGSAVFDVLQVEDDKDDVEFYRRGFEEQGLSYEWAGSLKN